MVRPETRRRRYRSLAALGVILVVAAACSSGAVGGHDSLPTRDARSSSPASAARSSSLKPPTPGTVVLTADVVRRENARPGDHAWALTNADHGNAIAGYPDSGSVRPGSDIHLHLRSTAGPLTVAGFRMGWYGGKLGRKVFEKASVPVGPTSEPVVVAASTRTSAAKWPVALTISTKDWLPGDYLFTLTAASGKQAWVPLTVTSPNGRGAVVIINATTTWQAYNAYGGRSLYHGADGAFRSRAYAVSDQRPYDFGHGSGDFAGSERPMVSLAEKLGLPLAYATSVDLDRDPHLLDGARAFVSLGHDEYWSSAMRSQVLAARDHGTNLAFFGANAAYRHIRFEKLAGAGQLEVDYKDGSDPIAKTHPSEATYQWRAGPDPRPESVLTGAYYTCNGVRGDLVAADASSWLTTGIVKPTDRLVGLLGDEYDQVTLGAPTPRPLQVLFHSPLTCRGRPGAADLVYYTTPSGAGGFDAATSAWVCVMGDQCGQPGANSPRNHQVVTAISTRLLEAFAAGPAGRAHPAKDTAARYSGHAQAIVESTS